MRRLAIAAALVALAVAAGAALDRGDAAAPTTTTTTGETPRVVSVAVNGSVDVTPDRAELSFGVETQAESARAALSANSTVMRRVLAALRSAGAGDLKTQSVWLSPRSDDTGKPAGYAASNTVSATIAVARVGTLIDAAVAAGATTVNGPSFTVSEREEAYRKALAEAVENARANAEALAAAVGGKVGAVVQVSESGAEQPLPMFRAEAAMASDATPVEAGTREVSASVTVTFELD